MTLFGIKNCNTVKKAMTWLKEKNIPLEFHDYKSKGVSEAKLKEWISQVGWESLINKKGTTWRKLDDAEKEKIKDANHAITLMKSHTSVIKRPIIEKEGKLIVIGFDETEYTKKF